MKFFVSLLCSLLSYSSLLQAVVPALLAAVAAEAQLPIAPQFLGQAGLYRGYSGYGAVPAVPYASAYSAPANFAYGAEITALNSAPVATAPVIGAVEYTAATPVIAEAVPAPVIAKAAPIAPIAPITASHSSQYQAQDELGNTAYGYQNINSAKQETGNAYGVTGSYTYSDEAGVHTVNYVADNLGFRVHADNLPVAPAPLAVAPVHVAEPVVDTPEVVEAKAAFFKAYNAAKTGVEKRSADETGYHPSAPFFPQAFNYAQFPALNYAGYQPYSAPLAYNGVSHLNYAAPYAAAAPAIAAPAVAAPAVAAPVAYNYPAAPLTTPYAAPVPAAGAAAPLREATLTTIKLNPGHATFYRVD